MMIMPANNTSGIVHYLAGCAPGNGAVSDALATHVRRNCCIHVFQQ
jgi:hypothetical protein